MTDKNKLIKIVDRGYDKYSVLKKLYDEVYDQYKTDKARFEAVNTLLEKPLTMRSWFRAKKVFEKPIVKKATKNISETAKKRREYQRNRKLKNTFKEKSAKIVEDIKENGTSKVPPALKKHIKGKPTKDIYKIVQSYINKEVDIPIVIDRPKSAYTDEEKDKILKNIFEIYGQGVSNLIKLCESQGIHHSTFLTWVDANSEHRKEWEKVQKRHVLSFIRIFKEFYKEQKLKEMFDDEEVFWTINYTFAPAINPETQKAEMQMVPTTATKHVRPRRLDNAVQQLFIDGMKDMYALETATELKVESEYDNMSLEDLLATQKELLNELEQKGDDLDE